MHGKRRGRGVFRRRRRGEGDIGELLCWVRFFCGRGVRRGQQVQGKHEVAAIQVTRGARKGKRHGDVVGQVLVHALRGLDGSDAKRVRAVAGKVSICLLRQEEELGRANPYCRCTGTVVTWAGIYLL